MGWFRNVVAKTLEKIQAAKQVGAAVSQAIQFGTWGFAQSTTRAGDEAYAQEGYDANAVVFKCVGLISSNLASAPLTVMIGEDEASEDHPLVQLLKRPNPMQGGSAFFETATAFHRLFGNSFIEAITPGLNTDNTKAPPMELWTWPAQWMTVLKSKTTRMPAGYKFEHNNAKHYWLIDEITGASNMLHWKTFNPCDPYLGLSPLSPAAFEVDQHNQAGIWNYSLLKNAGLPASVLTGEGTITEPQIAQIKEQLQKEHTGAENARKTMVFGGGLKWQQAAISPTDMDWLKGRDAAGRHIASVYNVPDQLVPIPGSQTFANYKEARLALWEDTVLPLLDELVDEFNVWLAPRYGNNVRIVVDRDAISALEPRRQERWTSVSTADWLTINEKREATGYEPYDGEEIESAADLIWIPSGLLPIGLAGGDEPAGPGLPEGEDGENVTDDDDDEEEVEE